MGITTGVSVRAGLTEPAGMPEPPRLTEPGQFALHYHRLGVLLYAPYGISVEFLPELMKFVQRHMLRGKKAILHTGIAWTCRAFMAITTEANAPAWMKHLDIGPGNSDWLKSCDCGTSSLTIWAAMAGDMPALRGAEPGVPHDADDFGRCHRLLKRYPAWRARLGEVATKFPEWAPYVQRWPQIEALFDAGNTKAVDHVLDLARAERTP